MNLNKILDELKQYKKKNKSEIILNAVNNRLLSSLSSYYSELDKSMGALKYSNNIRLMKKINSELESRKTNASGE